MLYHRSGNRIIDASRFAHEAHFGQTRKYIPDPYIFHPMRVAGRVGMFPISTEEMVIAAWLHDVLEDTRVPWQEIDKQFGQNVHTLVHWLTNGPYKEGMNRAARKEYDRLKLSQAPWQAKIIKMFDRIDNLVDFLRVPLEDAEGGFFRLYANESLQLSVSIGDANLMLAGELVGTAHQLLRKYPETV